MKLDSIDKKFLYGGIAAAVGLYLLKKTADKAVEPIKAVGEAVNPISNQNIFYRGSNALMGAVLSDWKEGDSIGYYLHRKIND